MEDSGKLDVDDERRFPSFSIMSEKVEAMVESITTKAWRRGRRFRRKWRN